MRKKILICGATGFIGRNLTEAFAKNDDYEVTAVINRRPAFECSNVAFVKADLTVKADVEAIVENQDVILQFAATTSGSKDIVQRPFIHVTDNAVMNSLLLRAAHESRVSHVVFPSCTVMYPSSDQLLKEQDFKADNGIEDKYFGVAWTKVFIEKQCEFYSRLRNCKFTVLRHSNIYGPHDKFDLERSHVCGASITKVMSADDGTSVTMWGSGEEERDLLFVDDLVEFVNLSLIRQRTPFELVNVGAGRSVTVKSLVEEIIKVSGKRLSIQHDLTKPTIKTKVALEISKALTDFGWSPKTSLQEGLAKTIAWYTQRSN